MKKVLSLLLVMGLCFALTACKKEAPAAENKKTKTLRITEKVFYDANGEETSRTIVTFNSKGLPDTVTVGANQYSFFYDQSGNLSYYEITTTNQTRPIGDNAVRFDHYGNVVERTGYHTDGTTPYQLTYEYTYNDKGATTTLTKYIDGTISAYEEYSYHDNGKEKSSIGYSYDQNGQQYKSGESTYDVNGNVLKVVNYNESGEITYSAETGYDSNGNIVKYTSSDGNEITCDEYTYDANGNILTKLTYTALPNGYKTGSTSVEYTYDQSGKLSKESRFSGGDLFKCTEYFYDENGLLTKATSDDGSTIEYTYDQQGKLTAEVERTTYSTTETRYDEFGRIVSRSTDSDMTELQNSTVYTYHEIEVTDVQANAFMNCLSLFSSSVFSFVEDE